ncbi:asparagine synthase (glutamine-hydrolyzing) [Pararhodospirillum oryzae]|uniref:asparagine synthase (glutamine-hydrolyzing) n=1 Tax=Pararhodospirillum oryzae TaxID=478448 RepID=A0A512H687_9PROT|nr:asparagine synthase (glutamine-hydrolyzing) [Pararhodospirillum oryzae]GEO80985.1 asparagine synthetase B [Pararhodospirillum oryzae]
MCGLTGFWQRNQADDPARLADMARRMADQLTHRGPDDAGTWVDPGAGLALGHRRLSIIDLSPAGHQPMVSASGRHVIVYNGELYNAAEIRADLEAAGVRFRGHADTEVLLEACVRWGVGPTLARLNGMFAFALWDGGDRRLTLARDPLGEKPLYVAERGQTLLFGSQPSSFFPHPAWRGTVDRRALAAMLALGCVPGPGSVFEGTTQVAPGTFVEIDASGRRRETVYWSLDRVAEAGVRARATPRSDAEAEEALDALLGDAVRRRLVSDVPLGAFLSGGIDSSTVVALMTRHASSPVRTFTIGFPEAAGRAGGYDESAHAAAVAAHLGTRHETLAVDGHEAARVVETLPAFFDEPFADSSQIPTVLVSRLARAQVTVSLSGDGGDELFAGYNRHVVAASVWPRLEPWPAWMRRAAAAGLGAVPARGWDALARALPARWRVPQAGDKVDKMTRLLRAASVEDFYLALVGADPARALPVAGGAVAGGPDPGGLGRWIDGRGRGLALAVDRVRAWDAQGYLPDDILTKVDRASMAVGLEARVPLLDPRVVAFAWSLDPARLVHGGRGKAVLRRVLARYVPPALTDRPKTGFGVPLDAWLRGPLRAWAGELLDPQALKASGLVDPDLVAGWWRAHQAGAPGLASRLWPVLMVEAWHRHWGPRGALR